VYFNIHILWIYGITKVESVAHSGSIEYKILDKSMENITLIGFSRDEKNNQSGHFITTKIESQCKVLNLKSNLPIRVMCFNIFLLLLLSLCSLVFAGLLIKKTIPAPPELSKQKQGRLSIKNMPKLRFSVSTTLSDLKNSPSQKRSKTTKSEINSLTMFIVYIGLFGAVFNLPSFLTKSCLMLTINIQPDEPSKFESSSINGIDWIQWQIFFSVLSDKLDSLILVSSSQKFLFFIFKCNLVKISTRRFCWIRCNWWHREEV